MRTERTEQEKEFHEKLDRLTQKLVDSDKALKNVGAISISVSLTQEELSLIIEALTTWAPMPVG